MAQMVKNLPTVQETWVRILPGEGNGNPLQEFLSEEFHGQRSLAGYSPKGHKELDRTEELTHTHTINEAEVLELPYSPVEETVEERISRLRERSCYCELPM